MIRLVVVALLLLTVNSVVLAQSMTALYRVAKIHHIYKLIDITCVETKETKEIKETKCDKSLHWRVYYQAIGQYTSPQQHQILLNENPPQLSSVVQLTLQLNNKKG